MISEAFAVGSNVWGFESPYVLRTLYDISPTYTTSLGMAVT